jgi:hypothetical protein
VRKAEHETIKVTVPRGLHKNEAKGVDYEPEGRLHQTLQVGGLGGRKGPNWHLIYQVVNGDIDFVGWEQTNKPLTKEAVEDMLRQEDGNSSESEEDTGMEVVEPGAPPPSQEERYIRRAYFYVRNYGLGGFVHGYIENATVKLTGVLSNDEHYYEALVLSGDTPQEYQSFTQDRPCVKPIGEKVWFRQES